MVQKYIVIPYNHKFLVTRLKVQWQFQFSLTKLKPDFSKQLAGFQINKNSLDYQINKRRQSSTEWQPQKEDKGHMKKTFGRYSSKKLCIWKKVFQNLEKLN